MMSIFFIGCIYIFIGNLLFLVVSSFLLLFEDDSNTWVNIARNVKVNKNITYVLNKCAYEVFLNMYLWILLLWPVIILAMICKPVKNFIERHSRRSKDG